MYKSSFITFLLLFSSFILINFLDGSVAQSNTAQKNAVMPEKHIAVLEEYCYDCHDSTTQKGKVNLEDLSFTINKDIKTAETWQEVLDAMNSDEMPPPDKRQVDTSLKASFLKDLSVQMVRARDILSDNGGANTMRRLNFREYEETMKKLLGVSPDIEGIPLDSGTGDFDTVGANLYTSSDQLLSYRSIAKQALKKALIRNWEEENKNTSKVFRVDFEKGVMKSYEKYRTRILGLKAKVDEYITNGGSIDSLRKEKSSKYKRIYKNYAVYYRKHIKHVDYILGLKELNTGVPLIRGRIPHVTVAHTTMRMPLSREYKSIYNAPKDSRMIARVRVGYYEGTPPKNRYIQYGLAGHGGNGFVTLGVKKVTAPIDNPQILEIPYRSIPGRNFWIKYRNHGDTWGNGDRYFRPIFWVDYIEVEGPLPEEGKTAPIYKGVPKQNSGENEKDYVRRVIYGFAKSAFRFKKPKDEYIEKLVDMYLFKNSGSSDDPTSFTDVFAIVLTSPSFIFIKENQMDQKKTRLSERETLIRLSYFLMSTPPDEMLLKYAEQGVLINPKNLRKIIKLVLKSKKSDAFLHSFLHQWLHMTRVDQFSFKKKKYPEMDYAVKKNARLEIYETFRYILDKGLPLHTLLKSDFIVINEVLADLYGIKGVEGSEFRKVSVPKDSPRGGLLGTAAFHIMGSDGNRTSPVERGAWVLRYLLNDPPPPAPANVPTISRLEGQIVPTRKLTKIHQELPQCASCHQKIDPIGFGFENFSATGLWRNNEIVEEKSDKKGRVNGRWGHIMIPHTFPIDPSGQLPSGEKFKNYFELRDAIAKHKDDFARGFTQHLVSYALGRPYSISDYNFVTKIVEKAAKENYKISSFIEALVLSEQFHTK